MMNTLVIHICLISVTLPPANIIVTSHASALKYELSPNKC